MDESLQRRQAAVRAFESRCRTGGLALTTQRRVIFETVLDGRGHPDAETLFAVIRNRLPGISRTTVYRVLDTLVRIGVISKALHTGAKARFDGTTGIHHHLVCVRCDRIIDVYDERLDALPRPNTRRLGFTITDGQVLFRGICAACRKREGGKSAGIATKS